MARGRLDRIRAVLVLALLALLPGCQVVEFIFKVGAWTATILIVILAAIVFGLVYLFRRKT